MERVIILRHRCLGPRSKPFRGLLGKTSDVEKSRPELLKPSCAETLRSAFWRDV